jgi:hypothetical protein
VGDYDFISSLYNGFVRYASRLKSSFDAIRKIKEYMEFMLVLITKYQRFLKYLKFFVSVWNTANFILGKVKMIKKWLDFIKWFNRLILLLMTEMFKNAIHDVGTADCSFVKTYLKGIDEVWFDRNFGPLLKLTKELDDEMEDIDKTFDEIIFRSEQMLKIFKRELLPEDVISL